VPQISCLRIRQWSGDNILSAPRAELLLWSESLFSAFFRKGQVVETFRGNGIWQPALDVAIEKLNQGHWVCVCYRRIAIYIKLILAAHVRRGKGTSAYPESTNRRYRTSTTI
jgi:hypothetical protein